MPGLGDQFPFVNPGDPIKAGGWNDIVRQLHALASIGDAGTVMATGAGIFRRSARRNKRSSACDYYHEIYIDGNPSSGDSGWSYTIDEDVQTVTITYNMTAAQLKTEILAEFSELESDDIVVTGGPLPNLHLYVKWVSTAGTVGYPPTAGTSTLDNDAQMKIGQINPR